MEQGRNDRLGAIWIQADLSGAGRVHHDYGKRIWRACLRGVAKKQPCQAQGNMPVRGSWWNDAKKVSAHIGRHKSILQVLLEKNG